MNFVVYSELSFTDILVRLASVIDGDGLKNIVNVAREDVLDGGFRGFKRKSFNACHLLSVRFSGEDGIDTGGLTREFLRLSLSAIQKLSIFCGPVNSRNLSLDYKGNITGFNFH